MLPPKIFISYSHTDREFVVKLARDLVRYGTLVWWDEWEIKVGDSLVQKIQEGIATSSYLGVVLSPDSVGSAWVQEELNAALVRQLKENRVIVLPILRKDCQLPLFLMDKRYADFREEYEVGLLDLVRALESPSDERYGRGDVGDYANDYVFDWGMQGGMHALRATIVSHSHLMSYSVYCTVSVVANQRFSARLVEYEQANFAWAVRAMLLRLAQDLIDGAEATILIESDKEATETYELRDPARGHGTKIDVWVRRIGSDPGSDLLYDWGSIWRFIAERHREGIKSAVTESERSAFAAWLVSHPM